MSADGSEKTRFTLTKAQELLPGIRALTEEAVTEAEQLSSRLQRLSSADPARSELKTIVRRIGSASAATLLLEINVWLQENPRHATRYDARYAKGYLLHDMGRTSEANRTFAKLHKTNYWLLKKIGDFENPPKPR